MEATCPATPEASMWLSGDLELAPLGCGARDGQGCSQSCQVKPTERLDNRQANLSTYLKPTQPEPRVK